MAGKYDSFDRSRHGAFVRSPYGAFNEKRLADVGLMVFVDEVSVYNESRGTFETHLASYQTANERLFSGSTRTLRLGVVHPTATLVPGAPLTWDGIQPFDVFVSGSIDRFDGPDKVFERIRSQRPPTRVELRHIFDSIAPILMEGDDTEVDVLVLMDESGSMTRASVSATFEPFKAELLEEFGARLRWHDPLFPVGGTLPWTLEMYLVEAVRRLEIFESVR